MNYSDSEYELFTKRVISEIVNVTVHHKRKYEGRISHRMIVVDVSFECEVAGAHLLFLVECKCYRRKVSVDEVEEFQSKINDIGAHKGIMVTTVGFQAGAIKTAIGQGIALALLTNSKQHGELEFIHRAAEPIHPGNKNEMLLNGNLRIDFKTQAGFRFEGGRELIAILMLYEGRDLKKP